MKLLHDQHAHRLFGTCEACEIEAEWKRTPGCTCLDWLIANVPTFADAQFFDQHGHYPACAGVAAGAEGVPFNP